MATEIALSFSTLRAQLESEKSSLFKIDENIKKIVQTSGRFSDRFNGSAEYPQRGARAGGRNSFPDVANNYKTDDQLKRKHETKTVFSRISARTQDSDGEDDSPVKKSRMSSAVCRELPTRASVLRAQGNDEQARTRNRRMFGSLLGTLQKFKQEEIVLQTKEDKKAQVEKKIEEQARLEKEKAQKERKTLFVERELKKTTIKALEAKMARVQEFETWESSQKCLGNFILTKAKPHVYWLPKGMSEKAEEKLSSSRKYHEKCMRRKREELQEELQRIEQRCRRLRAPAKENEQSEGLAVEGEVNGGEDKSKRDKFAMDVDEKEREESDEEEKHYHLPLAVQHVKEADNTENNKMETSTEQPAGEQPAGEQPAGEQPAGEKPAEEQPTRDQPAVDQSAEQLDTPSTPKQEPAQPQDTVAEGD